MKPSLPHPTHFVPQIVFLSFKDTVDREKESWGSHLSGQIYFIFLCSKGTAAFIPCCLIPALRTMPPPCLQIPTLPKCILPLSQCPFLPSCPASSQLTLRHPLSMLTEVILLARCPRAWKLEPVPWIPKLPPATNWLCDPVCKLLKTLYHSYLVCGRDTFLVFRRVTLWIK